MDKKAMSTCKQQMLNLKELKYEAKSYECYELGEVVIQLYMNGDHIETFRDYNEMSMFLHGYGLGIKDLKRRIIDNLVG